ncbi:hypothetical protein [Streptomyces atratus]|uniref:hypothetical protein n=1 Tax=Streptomyces atratus TaxID=1893 RepID=UPI0032460622
MERSVLRRRALAACTATVAVGVLALAGLTGSASADPAPDLRPTRPPTRRPSRAAPGRPVRRTRRAMS